jgi:CBS domain-containing protein
LDFLTQILGARAGDAGRVRDVIARIGEHEGDLPRVAALVLSDGRAERAVAWTGSIDPGTGAPRLAPDATSYEPGTNDLFLRRDVLDKQIVDVSERRVVRVSDVRLAVAPGGGIVVLGVDPTQKAVLRRLLPLGLGDALTRKFGLADAAFIAWSDVEPTTASETGVLRLRTTRDALKQLHPADIADILEQMTPLDRTAMLASLDVETAADVVTEADEEIAAQMIEQLPAHAAADILEEMEPDDAADVLGDVSGSKRRQLLDEMDDEEAEDVKELLAYDENTAGGLMTTEFVALPSDLTAEQAIQKLRELAPRAETIYYVFVTQPDERLVGVISLRDLIVAAPDQPLWNVMVEDVIRVGADASLEEVASALEHYDLLAVPVVDDDDHLQGIVTVDDTLEELLPASWRRKRFQRRRGR